MFWIGWDVLILCVWTVFEIGKSIHCKKFIKKEEKNPQFSLNSAYLCLFLWLCASVCVCRCVWVCLRAGVSESIVLCVYTRMHLPIQDIQKREEAKLAWLPVTTFLLMQPLLEKLACQRNKTKKGTLRAPGRRREIPDVCDMRAIQLISQHVYTQRTAAVSDCLVRNKGVTPTEASFQHPSDQQCHPGFLPQHRRNSL